MCVVPGTTVVDVVAQHVVASRLCCASCCVFGIAHRHVDCIDSNEKQLIYLFVVVVEQVLCVLLLRKINIQMNLVLQLRLQFLSLLSTLYFNVFFFFNCLNLFFFLSPIKNKRHLTKLHSILKKDTNVLCMVFSLLIAVLEVYLI